MARLHPSLEGSRDPRLPTPIRPSRRHHRIRPSRAPFHPLRDGRLPLRPRDAPSSPSRTPVVPFFTPPHSGPDPRPFSRWQAWRSASVVCARLTTSMPYRRKLRSCFFSPRVAAHHPLLLTLLPRPPSVIPFSPPRGGLDPRPYLLTLLPSPLLCDPPHRALFPSISSATSSWFGPI